MKLNIPSPLQELDLPNVDQRVWIKRDDLIHPYISGNKWRKLKYHLQAFKQSGKSAILTFGGAFSNHLYATAAACQAHHIPCYGIVRGLEVDVSNPTLSFCKQSGMKIITVSRQDYQIKDKAEVVDALIKKMNCFVVPEGGNNENGQEGVKEIITEIASQLGTNHFSMACAIGTGTTIKGLVHAAQTESRFLGFMASQDAALETELSNIPQMQLFSMPKPYQRFGSMDDGLAKYINAFYAKTGIALDPLYTGKMMMGLEQYLRDHKMEENPPLVILHTGGLQGIMGYNYRAAVKAWTRIDVPIINQSSI